MSDDEHVQASDDAEFTYPVQCSSLRKNGHVVIKGRPCKIVDVLTNTDEHGDVYVKLVGIDIFTGKKLEDQSPSIGNMDVPNVSRNEYQLLNIDEGFLNLMASDGASKDDVKLLEDDLGRAIFGDFDNGKDVSCPYIILMTFLYRLICEQYHLLPLVLLGLLASCYCPQRHG